MQMWGGDPIVINPDLINAVFQRQLTIDPGPGDPPPYEVVVTVPGGLAGQTISLLRNGDVIGKATVGADGRATIPASFGDGAPKDGELQVAMEPDGAEPVRAPVHGAPQATRITQTCPASSQNQTTTMKTSGTLSPAAAGLTIVVRYDRPNGEGSFERNVQTDANGNWSDSIVPGEHAENYDGDWKITPRFDGTEKYAPSQG